MDNRGFTLIEMVVAISIMAVIGLFAASVFTPAVNIYRRTVEQGLSGTLCRTILTVVENNIGYAEEIELRDSAPSDGLYYASDNGRVYLYNEGEAMPLFTDEFYNGQSVTISFSTESEAYGGSRRDIVFITLEARNADGVVTERIESPCAPLNISGRISGVRAGGAAFSMPDI